MTERRSTFRQRVTAFLIAGVGGLVASAVSFAMTLYDAAHPPQTPTVAAGERIDAGRWFVTLYRARAGSVPPTGIPSSMPKRLIMVDLEVVNRSAAPNNVLHRVVRPDPPVADLQMPTPYLERDKYLAGSFNPDMPERITLVWEWPEAAPVPETLSLVVTNQIYKRRDNLYGASGWFDRDPVARVDLPVTAAP